MPDPIHCAPDSALARLAPTMALTGQQEALKAEVLAFCRAHRADDHALFVIEGDAGTGKSLLLNTLFTAIQQAARGRDGHDPLHGTRNWLLVNHPEMIKLYRNISESRTCLRKKDFERPTTFINQMSARHDRADIVLVDEAHLLLTRSDPYNRFRQDNQLAEIIRHAHVVVIIFDAYQVLKFKSLWNDATLRRLVAGYPVVTRRLDQQFRVHAHADVMTWIHALRDGRLLPLPAPQPFDFRIFDDAQAMYDAIRQRNAQYGMCRMLATYDYPYTLNGHDHFITEGRFHLRWDRAMPQARLPWAERPDTIDEVGSVYTIQGFDLNYAGVILGPSVGYDPAADRIVIDPSRYEDRAAFTGRDGVENPQAVMERIILNSINVLMTRGVRGLYIYASDPRLHARLAALWRARQDAPAVTS
ncbi:DUF2075 domain-containing protein [Komagataeibacter oboediens]|uniref:DUF2075 domain-containing protein n=1 Tax=Komagataeibacter oboediens TaxID=65958 RepID=A0ABS5SNJ9_9PROT|nr:DUF2075 domain-containing protein [Komagataeibacter oboediens]MBL7233410.1 DUF2075 domain-containing protein [Komagataeibacter oboediens]MBT0675756.1 DUF2075 domain-containing protein [Komagataeibacter oboediens]MBT0678237.1 DUF2075 domain-containing protein [Komagataeibacter oboediens]MBV0887899.1 DUF2075 domain-containing protein [Komagataeibacter oboediens]MCK9818755.1 DUF2075 domain-containing protein [Komagataeibacter oboediens]